MPSAERVAWAKFRVSTVIVVALTILGTVTYLLTGATLFVPQTVLYLYLPDATGLLAGSPVRVNGIGVGKIQSVLLTGGTNPDRIVKLTMTIERDRLVSITADSTAQIASETAVGDKYVAISSGTSASHVQPNSELSLKSQPAALKTQDLEQFQKQVDAIDALLRDIEQGKNRVGEFVVGDLVYTNLLKRIVEVERAVRTMADTKDNIGRELYTDRLYQQIRDPIVSLDQSLARMQAGTGSIGQFLRDPAQYDQLRDSAQKLRKTVADLRSETFLKSDQPYEDWSRQLVSLIRKVNDFNGNPLLTSTAVYENLNGAVKEARQTAKEFRENPKKFLRLKVF